MPHDVKEHKTLNAIQVTIDNNIRMLAELHARWEREEKEAEIAEISKVANVCTIYTNEDIKMLNAQESSTAPKYANGKRIGVGKFSTMPKKNPKLSVNTETVVDKNAEISFDNMDSLGDNAPVIFMTMIFILIIVTLLKL